MHNIHTPAPYFYGWTVLSLIPSFLGQNQLQLTIFLFRLFMILGWYWWLKGITALGGKKYWLIALAINPLVLIEVVGNIHNDVYMMAPMVWSLYCFRRSWPKRNKWLWVACLLFLFSISVKYASVMILVGVVMWKLGQVLNRKISWGGAQIIAHFLPLLTRRSQWFLPWYLIWSLTFVPIAKEKIVQATLLMFTVTGLLSYIPFLLVGEYTPSISFFRSLILFLPPLSYAVSQWLLNEKKS
jgi:hypothetical protein